MIKMIFLFPGDIPPDCSCLELVCKYKRLNEFTEENKQKIVCMPTGSFAWSADWLEWKSRICPGEWDEVKVQVPLNHEEESWKLGSYVVLGWSIIRFTARINPDTWHGCHSYMWSGLAPRRGLSESTEPRDSGSHLSLLKSMQKKLNTKKFVFRPETLSEET